MKRLIKLEQQEQVIKNTIVTIYECGNCKHIFQEYSTNPFPFPQCVMCGSWDRRVVRRFEI